MANPLIISSLNLLSRIIRKNLSNGLSGRSIINNTGLPERPRKIESVSSLDKNNTVVSGVLARIFQTVKNFFGWAWSTIYTQAKQAFNRALDSLFTSAFGYLVSTVNNLWTFDWNQSDQALLGLLKSQETILGGAWGSLAGQGVGWIAALGVGYGMGHRAPVIGSGSLARLIASRVAEEAGEELAFGLRNALQVSLSVATRSFVVTRFVEIRRWVKSLPDSKLSAIVGADAAKWLKNEWGNGNGPNMSFAEQLDRKVEKIPNKFWQAFIEEALEESWDSFIEGGFIIAQELDTALSQARLNRKLGNGPKRTLELQPDRQNDDEVLRYVDVGQDDLIDQVQADLNQHRLLFNRDVGMIAGQPGYDHLINVPQSLRIVVCLFSVKQPPYNTRAREKLTRVEVTIPDVKRSALDWERIKLACGGRNGYMWGRFRANCRLENGRSFFVFGATPDEAEERAKSFLTLSTSELLTMTVTEEKKLGARAKNPKLQKEPTRVYPAYFTVFNRELVLDPEKGKNSTQQRYLDRKGRILLWTDNKPPDFERVINMLFRSSP